MRYGVCVNVKDPATVATAKQAGFDFVECDFTKLADASDDIFGSFADALEENGIRCETANCFLPGRLPLFDGHDAPETADFLKRGFARAGRLGVGIIVFGSGGARNLPENADFSACYQRFISFLRETVSPAARSYDMTVAVEPLCRGVCNFINTLSEGAMVVAAAGRDNIALLADNYHMEQMGEDVSLVRRMKGMLVHSHISYPHAFGGRARVFPSADRAWDYGAFIRAVADAGCDRCSVEASALDFEKDSFAAAKLLHSVF